MPGWEFRTGTSSPRVGIVILTSKFGCHSSVQKLWHTASTPSASAGLILATDGGLAIADHISAGAPCQELSLLID